jgi:hypothetical protein
MKLKTLAAAVALLQIGAAALPTAAALAGDHGRGHNNEDRGGGGGDRGGKDWGRGGGGEERRDGRGEDRYQNRDEGRGGNNNYFGVQAREERHDNRRDEDHYRGWDRPGHDDNRDHYRGGGWLPFYHGPNYRVPEGRIRYYRDIPVVRPYGHWYSGYGRYRDDDDAFAFLAFAAISLVVLDLMSERQQRALEDAQIRATRTPIGVPVQWNDGNAYGSVTPLRDGNDQSGRYCREFQQMVKINGKQSKAYGTACRQPDGTWQIVATQ